MVGRASCINISDQLHQSIEIRKFSSSTMKKQMKWLHDLHHVTQSAAWAGGGIYTCFKNPMDSFSLQYLKGELSTG